MDTQLLRNRIQKTIQDNFSHIIASVIVMTIASTILSVPLTLIMLFVVGDAPLSTANPLSAMFFSLIIGYLSLLVTIFLTYGLSVLLGRFYRGEQAVIGHLFWGLRDLKRLSLIPLLLFGIILAASLIFTFAFEAVMEPESPAMLVTMVLIPVMVLIILVVFPYLFTFCIMYESPDLSLMAVLRKSRQMLKKKKWAAFCFGLSMMRLPLGIWLVSFVLVVTVGIGGLLGRIAFYFMLIYQLLTWNALFYQQLDDENPSPEIPVLEVLPCESASDTPAQN